MSDRRVLILMGSDSDFDAMKEVGLALDKMGIGHDMHVASAHRTPERVARLAREARGQGFGVIVAGAGMAAHLAGVVASYTTLPVIGVPLASGTMAGADALFSTIQMPRGIPVATVGIGPAGCFNAGLLAAAMLAVQDPDVQQRLEAYRADLSRQVEEKDAALQRRR
ncbi:MAG TPA: 5-(carboxyamino)imidazole ribonucleotide mutase [Myxococcota bacterium]|nr:5-(carboxyamino)imidazole ribonucleotide mutase [Myxococcota bacterium]HRY96160.1 5-(carboxyamino)imidazole ribonucleotide mutase [Myxococcota bacterium]